MSHRKGYLLGRNTGDLKVVPQYAKLVCGARLARRLVLVPRQKGRTTLRFDRSGCLGPREWRSAQCAVADVKGGDQSFAAGQHTHENGTKVDIQTSAHVFLRGHARQGGETYSLGTNLGCALSSLVIDYSCEVRAAEERRES